ncbi:MAG: addiction module antidote protein, HigA family [Tagaea sp. CACIAM 22H2]|nr:addiction module antidote protein, HigA family [Tagaea sp. CACIAM 22H2]
MTKFQTREIAREPTHPGELINEIVHEHLKLSTADAAARMGVRRQTLHRVLSCAGAVSPEMALRFSAVAGGSAEMFLRMQGTHDLWRAKRRIAKDLSRIAAAPRTAA